MPRRSGRTRFVPNAPSVGLVAIAPLALVGLMIPLGVLLPMGGYPVPVWVVLGALGVVIVPMVVVIVRVTRFTSRVSRSDGFLCLNCHYDLHGLPDAGECPECGEPYSREELERRWGMWLLSQTKSQRGLRARTDARATRGPDR